MKRTKAMNNIIRMYWRPLYAYARGKGMREDDAQDIVQSFLLSCLEKDLFPRADRARGRFRNLMRIAFDNFAANAYRAEQAKRRAPVAGTISIHALVSKESQSQMFEPRSNETPEDVYNRIWAGDLLSRALNRFKLECAASGKQLHHSVFELRIVKPILEGVKPPSMRELARHNNMEEKQIANILLTARRVFQRLLREEIGAYEPEDASVAAEIAELFDSLSKK